MIIQKEFVFEAAHHLPFVPDGHKCKNMHGHSFHVVVALEGPVEPLTGMVCDFAVITAAWEPLRALLDHRTLNDIHGLENPTSENLAVWIWNRLASALPRLARVEVAETHSSRCVYTGPLRVNQLILSTIQAVGTLVFERDMRGKCGQS